MEDKYNLENCCLVKKYFNLSFGDSFRHFKERKHTGFQQIDSLKIQLLLKGVICEVC